MSISVKTNNDITRQCNLNVRNAAVQPCLYNAYYVRHVSSNKCTQVVNLREQAVSIVIGDHKFVWVEIMFTRIGHLATITTTIVTGTKAHALHGVQ